MASKHYNSEAHQQNDEELRIVMVGKTGIGKSATGNTILGHKCFYSKFSANSTTDECSKGTTTVDGQKVAVIDTPGLFDTRCDTDKMDRDISQCISYSSPGPDVFLVVIRLGRFTEEEKQTVQKIQEMFGEAADRYSMVLFTHGDLLGDTTIEEFMKESKGLKDLIARCGGLYHVFNNKLKERSQVTELLQKISDLVKKNGGSHYTSEMFQEAERKLEEETQRILKEKEEQIRKEKEELEMKLRAKFEEELRCVTEKIQAELEEEKGKLEIEKTLDWKTEEEIKKEREEKEKEWTNREDEIKKDREERETEWTNREDEIKKEREERETEWTNREDEIKKEREERETEWTNREDEIKKEREERETEWKKREEETKKEGEEEEKERRKREEERKEEGREKERSKRGNQSITERLSNQFKEALDRRLKEVDKKHQHEARQEAEKKIPFTARVKKFIFSLLPNK